jgi:diguanylate cyclase (GGDEF)-like protein/PAS domain S-box-containing protein
MASEELFQSAFENAPTGMVLTDLDDVVISANPAFGRIVGREPLSLEGTNLQELTHPDDWSASNPKFCSLMARDVSSTEQRLLHTEGRMVWVSMSSSCVRDVAGAPLYLIRQIEDITERRAAREHLAHAAIHDPLTNLPNRTLFTDRVDLALLRAKRLSSHVAVIFIDLDRFKIINDSLGHDAGDRVLQAVAKRLSSALRAGDTLARFGGDEFTVLCDEVRDRSHLLEIADRLRVAMTQPLDVEDGQTFVSVSIGAALSTESEESGATLLRHADIAMYRAKELGPARIGVFTEDDARHADIRVRTSDQLHRAIERHELELHYQPFVHLGTMKVVATEALVRWRHPTRGLLLPGEFLNLAEETGLIVPLGLWVLEEACAQAARWQVLRNYPDNENWKQAITVNISPRQLTEPAFIAQVDEIIERTKIDPDTLWLEVTEGTLLWGAERAVGALRAIRDLGAHIAIDDFGTGYSSLSYLKQLPVESLKIDRSFVEGLGRDPQSSAIVRAIIALADSLGLLCVAEGIERSNQAQILRDLGCRVAQGYLLGRPKSAAQLEGSPVDDLRSWNASIALV